MSTPILLKTLDVTAGDPAARSFRALHHLLVGIGVVAAISSTDPPILARWLTPIELAIWLATLFFAAEVGLRAWLAAARAAGEPARRERTVLDYLASPAGMVDVLAAIAVPLPLLLGAGEQASDLLGVVWTLKLARYSSGLSLLGRVLRNAADPLLSVLLSFVIVLVGAATLAYLLEGRLQPEAFGSIPRAIWWTIVTLTTTGYGDAVPIGLPGRLLAGVVMVAGIGLFGLWAGVLASSFAEELRRRDFLRTWGLVARVPFFRDLGADAIAEVTRILRRRVVSPGQAVVRRGQPGEAMFFIVSGELDVMIAPHPIRLAAGQFFGEMALLTGAPRSATVTAARPSVLLELDVADFHRLAAARPELMQVIEREAARRAAPPADT